MDYARTPKSHPWYGNRDQATGRVAEKMCSMCKKLRPLPMFKRSNRCSDCRLSKPKFRPRLYLD